MLCPSCGPRKIADNALVCYRCGVATSQPRAAARPEARARSRVPVVLALLVLGAARSTSDRPRRANPPRALLVHCRAGHRRDWMAPCDKAPPLTSPPETPMAPPRLEIANPAGRRTVESRAIRSPSGAGRSTTCRSRVRTSRATMRESSARATSTPCATAGRATAPSQRRTDRGEAPRQRRRSAVRPERGVRRGLPLRGRGDHR